MATLNFTTSDAEFTNSGDNKLVLKGYAPTAVILTVIAPSPGSASLSLSGQNILGNIQVTPGTGSLTITSDATLGLNPTPSVGSIALSGIAPASSINVTKSPGVGSFAVTGQQALRGVGLQLVGQTPITDIDVVKSMPVGSAAFSGKGMTALIAPADSHAVAPEAATPAITGGAITLDYTVPGSVATLGLSTAAPTISVDAPVSPGSASLAFFSEPIGTDEPPKITITPSPTPGTAIVNNNAVQVPSNYQICDRTGFKVKVKEGLVEQWDGTLVRRESYEPRNLQDFVKTRPDHLEGAIRPEQDDRFIEDEFPDGVTVDDL